MSYIGNKPANKAVVASDLDPAVITGQTALAVAPADTDEFLISDAGTLKRIDASLIGGGGKVLQVITDTLTSEYTTSSNTFNDTGLTLDITPSATSSKILIIAHLGGMYSNTSTNKFIFTCLRGSTNLGHTNYGFGFTAGFTDGRILVGDGFTFLDSPSSTSQLTYKVQGRSEDGSGSGQIAQNGATATLTCLEIGA